MFYCCCTLEEKHTWQCNLLWPCLICLAMLQYLLHLTELRYVPAEHGWNLGKRWAKRTAAWQQHEKTKSQGDLTADVADVQKTMIRWTIDLSFGFCRGLPYGAQNLENLTVVEQHRLLAGVNLHVAAGMHYKYTLARGQMWVGLQLANLGKAVAVAPVLRITIQLAAASSLFCLRSQKHGSYGHWPRSVHGRRCKEKTHRAWTTVNHSKSIQSSIYREEHYCTVLQE